MPMLRADFGMAEQYRPLPGPRLACPVTALAGLDDPWVDEPGLEAWRGVTTGRFHQARLPGDHFYLAPGRERLMAVVTSPLCGRVAA